MGKQIITIAICLGISVLLGLNARGADSIMTLQGQGEGLWGNKIDLAKYRTGNTIIVPFSPSNCGYCLIDGELIRKNYLEPNAKAGGANFYMSLFTPQADNYEFLKHYREADQTVLTFPASLYDYHQDGFPFLIYFRKGNLLYAGGSSPYDQVFDSLRSALSLPGPDHFQVPSGAKIVNNLVGDTKQPNWIVVLPDTLHARLAEVKDRMEKTPGNHVLLESELREANLHGHVDYSSAAKFYSFEALAGQKTPISIDADSIRIGRYHFSRAEVGMHIFFPNPYDPRRTVLIKQADAAKEFVVQNWTDFAIWRHDSISNGPQVLLDGLFEKHGDNDWSFADSLTTAYVDLKDRCAGGICPVKPAKPSLGTPAIIRPMGGWEKTSTHGIVTAFGGDRSRFPSIAAGSDGTIGLAWEEHGSLFAATLRISGDPVIVTESRRVSDEYSPKIAWDGRSFGVVYLSDEDRYYRCFLRYIEGGHFGEPVPISPKGSYDAITPAIASDGLGNMTVAWSEWKANYRHPRFCTIANRVPAPIQEIRSVESKLEDYVDAWFFDLAYAAPKQVLGVWNQHYPSILGVCSGDLSSRAVSITRLGNTVEDGEVGGYPSLEIDKIHREWVVWQTDGWATYGGTPQKILVAVSPVDSSQWSIPWTISSESQTYYNETPRTAMDSTGNLWVVWSGRARGEDSKWGIYVSKRSGEGWSSPKLISESGETGRAPDLCVASTGEIWVTWHAGEGEKMKIRLLHFDPKTI